MTVPVKIEPVSEKYWDKYSKKTGPSNPFPDWNARTNLDICIHNTHAKLRKPSFTLYM